MRKIKKSFIVFLLFMLGTMKKVFALVPLYGPGNDKTITVEPTIGEKIARAGHIISPILLFIVGLFVLINKKLTKKEKAIMILTLAIIGTLLRNYLSANSYQEDIFNSLKIIAIASIFALISMIIYLIIGKSKKDCLVILVANIMVKTVVMSLYQILILDNILIVILFFIATVIIEGFIYKKLLKYKNNNGVKLSIICNMGTILILLIFVPSLLF